MPGQQGWDTTGSSELVVQPLSKRRLVILEADPQQHKAVVTQQTAEEEAG